jgi:hypothetical protein
VSEEQPEQQTTYKAFVAHKGAASASILIQTVSSQYIAE